MYHCMFITALKCGAGRGCYELACWIKKIPLAHQALETMNSQENKQVLEEINPGPPTTRTNNKTEAVVLRHVVRLQGDRREKPLTSEWVEASGREEDDTWMDGWMDEIRDTTKLMIDDLREVTRDRIGWRQLIIDSTMMLMGHHITVQNSYLHLLIPKQNNLNIKHKLYSKISSFTLLQFRKKSTKL